MDNSGQDRLITLKEAAGIAQRSLSTMRAWVRKGKLEDKRAAGDKVSAVVVSYRQVLLLCSNQKQMRSGGQVTAQSDTMLVDTLKAQIDDLKHDKKEMRAELSYLRQELESARDRIHALEGELNGGFRGLIRSAVFGKK